MIAIGGAAGAISRYLLQGWVDLSASLMTEAPTGDLPEAEARDELPALNFLDLDWKIVNKQLERERQKRRSGPVAIYYFYTCCGCPRC